MDAHSRPLGCSWVVGHSRVFGEGIARKIVVLSLSSGRVLPGTGVPLILGFLETASSPSVQLVNLDEAKCHYDGRKCKHYRWEKHDHCGTNVCAEEGNGWNPTTGSPTGDPNCLYSSQKNLGCNDEEKCHEIKGAVRPESFIKRPEPAYVAAGTENDEPKESQAEVDTITTTDPPSQASDQVHYQSDAIKHPYTVNLYDQPPVVDGDFIFKVLVEARFQTNKLWQWREIIDRLCHASQTVSLNLDKKQHSGLWWE